MKIAIVASLISAIAVFAPVAMADEADAVKAMKMSTPAISETKAAKADWYRQFIKRDAPDTRPVWQVEPTDDISISFDNDRRWALNLELLSRPTTSPLPREEMQAGATFRITPRFSIGGEVSVAANELNSAARWEAQDLEAGIRLKSAFKF